jgi:hypothetical protein
MTPKHYESDTKVHRGRITSRAAPSCGGQRSRPCRRYAKAPIGHARVRIGQRRGANIGNVAAARKRLTLVFYGLRDGHIRCLARPA